jgi:hypothetical protein
VPTLQCWIFESRLINAVKITARVNDLGRLVGDLHTDTLKELVSVELTVLLTLDNELPNWERVGVDVDPKGVVVDNDAALEMTPDLREEIALSRSVSMDWYSVGIAVSQVGGAVPARAVLSRS